MKRHVFPMLLIMFLAALLPALALPSTRHASTRSQGAIMASLVPTGPITLTDNASVAAVADSGSGTKADPYVIENRSFQLNYSASGILWLGVDCYLIIRNCFLNASDPTGVGMAFLVTSGGEVYVDNCTVMNTGTLGIGYLGLQNARVTNIVMINNTGVILDTVDNFYAENITLFDSPIAILDLGILSHSMSNNVTFKNVISSETGSPVTGVDMVVSEVDGLRLENFSIICDSQNCSTYIFNSTNVELDQFYREAPECGLNMFNVTNFSMVDSAFVMDDNSSVVMNGCNSMSFVNSTFEVNGSSTGNFNGLDCTGIVVDGCEFSGGNSTSFKNCSLSITNSSFTNSSLFLSNNTGLNVTIEQNLFDLASFHVNCSITNETISNNAYWDYFTINTGFATYYFYDGQILPIEYEFLPGYNDTMPYYSNSLFGPRVNITPVANFIANTTIILEGDHVLFNFTGTAGNRPCTFIWDFGDASVLLGENVTHQYLTPGTYSVSVNVTDSDGQNSVLNQTGFVVVGESILADYYIQGYPHRLDAGVKYTMVFDGVASLLPSTYSWTFGDGGFSLGTTVSHKYQRAGSYTITLTVTDSVGHSDIYSKTIVVSDNAGSEPPAGGEEPLVVPLSAGWQGILVAGIVIATMIGVLIFVRRSMSSKEARGRGRQRRSPARAKSRKT